MILEPFLSHPDEEKIDSEEKEARISKPREEKLTKAQKRRLWDKGGDDRQRGWDWVCIIRHLSQAPHEPTLA